MDLLDIIITIAILGVGSLLTGGKKLGKKAAPQQVVPPLSKTVGEDLPSASEKAGEIWAEMFGEDIDDVEEQSSQEVDYTPEVDANNGYFTYENPAFDEEAEIIAEVASRDNEEFVSATQMEMSKMHGNSDM